MTIDGFMLIALFFIAGITCWLLYKIESLENNNPKKKKEIKVSLFDDSFNRLCSLINNKIRTTYLSKPSENSVTIPIGYELSNKITMLSDEEEHKLLKCLKNEYKGKKIRVNYYWYLVIDKIYYAKITDVEFANYFKGPYTTVILKFKV